MDPEAIVRALAAREPIVHDQNGNEICALCRQRPEIDDAPVEHSDDCPWQLAFAWVDEQGLDTVLN
jgi:hypothetical protein